MNETTKIIPPSVGRQVHFHFASSDVSLIAGWNDASNNTYAATVAFVHSDRLVNLSVIDAGGYTYGMQSIPLCQPGDERPLGNWCEWPPHTAAMSRPPGRVPTLQSAGEPPTLNQVAHPAIAATQQLDNDGNALAREPVVTGCGGQASPDPVSDSADNGRRWPTPPTIPQD